MQTVPPSFQRETSNNQQLTKPLSLTLGPLLPFLPPSTRYFHSPSLSLSPPPSSQADKLGFFKEHSQQSFFLTFHRLLLLFLPFNISDLVNLCPLLFLIFYILFNVLYSLWTTSSTSAFNQCPRTGNCQILPKQATSSNLCVQLWSTFCIISLNSMCSVLDLSAWCGIFQQLFFH